MDLSNEALTIHAHPANVLPTGAGPLPGRNALVCYGSETGNAQEAAEELARIAGRLRFSTRTCDLNSTPIVSPALPVLL